MVPYVHTSQLVSTELTTKGRKMLSRLNAFDLYSGVPPFRISAGAEQSDNMAKLINDVNGRHKNVRLYVILELAIKQ